MITGPKIEIKVDIQLEVWVKTLGYTALMVVSPKLQPRKTEEF